MTGRNARVAVLLAAAALVLALTAAACAGSDTTTTTSQPSISQTTTPQPSGPTTTAVPAREFTLDELAQFDGLEGRPAYVAVDGVVYDVSGSTQWAQGSHSSCSLGASAGRDLSELIRQAPATMRALLEQMPVVGSLVQ